MTVRALTRAEGKLITRRRLVEAATRVLSERSVGGLSVSAIAREAGIAQPTFYVHFKDKDDLLNAIAAEKIAPLWAPVRAARARIREGSGVDAIRETFRLPLQHMVEQGELYRLYLQQLHEPASPLGEQARRLSAEARRDLAEDLAWLGLPSTTPRDREQLDMIAESIIAQTQALGLAYLEGRYSSLDDVVEVLTRFAVGILGFGMPT